MNLKVKLCSILLLFTILVASAKQQCATRLVKDESVVCVCNTTYCDEIIRTIPKPGNFFTYTSSKEGYRFKNVHSILRKSTEINENCCSTNLVIDPSRKYQRIEGFGGAVTDAAGINWKQLSEPLQKYLIDSYFSKTGLEYNTIRVPIGGSDFSTHPYSYNELPVNDVKLNNFSLSREDYMYKIPMINESLKAATQPINIIATTWSPPTWMKTNEAITGYSRLKEQYFQTYADYHLKFIQKYSEEGINIWAITTTNEPVNGIIPIARFNSLGWTPQPMTRWILNNLGPTIRNSIYNSIKILALDDQRYMIPLFFDKMVQYNSSVMKYIDGLALHYYADFYTPASMMSNFAEKYPDKFIIATEACEGSYPWETQKVIFGSWKRAENYISDIMEDLNHYVSGWIDWNLCLNSEGGPNWAKNFVDSPIIITGSNEFIKQPMYYAMGHFSKFIPRNSRRIHIENKSWWSELKSVAFVTPEETIVVALYNRGSRRMVRISIGEQALKLKINAASITTIEIKI